jgi:hypothetical protein
VVPGPFELLNLQPDTMESQMEESREVNNSFPDALKGPILRRTQFSTVSRVDNLGPFASLHHNAYMPV